MFKRLGLHTTPSKAEWEYIAPSQYNFWQKLAAHTRGIVTIGNLISLGGAFIVLWGLVLTINNSLIGLLLMVVGRIFDILDGIAAERTGTKSPLGEIMDATIDKLLAFVVVIGLYSAELLPFFVAFFLFIHSLFNGILSMYGRTHRMELHPSRAGKLAIATSWVIIIVYGLFYLQTETGNEPILLLVLAHIIFVIFAILAVISSTGYLLELRKARSLTS